MKTHAFAAGSDKEALCAQGNPASISTSPLAVNCRRCVGLLKKAGVLPFRPEGALERKRALSCGYATEEALRSVERLDSELVKLLAAMAITCKDSAWSDRLRDLLRGAHEAMGEKWWEEA